MVHGRNNEAKEAVARFLERLDLDVVILHEQPDKGRTLIEKFEEYASVGYAVVLITADDVGTSRDAIEDLRPRGRQNVIPELRYFLGALGRTNVCAPMEEGVEIPSDLSGVLYVPLDPCERAVGALLTCVQLTVATDSLSYPVARQSVIEIT